ncbi:MAG: class I SAM-dependent methyltransferase [Desulfomonile tiedjei]|nr:class I SAM-dependent methyltransferase [Desulfomonile tiedjei]
MLSHEQARDFYDRFGSKQDWQRFYEDPAVADLVEHLSLESAGAVVEFGCGTGRVAESMLAYHLPQGATYLGLDVSSTMVALARRRLEHFGPRAKVLLTSGETRLEAESAGFDRYLSTYVLDLLTETDIQAVVAEAHRILGAGGLLGLASLTHGFTLVSKVFEKVWLSIYRIRPTLVGGCRPISLETFVRDGWNIRHMRKQVSFGVPSQVLVAEKL